MENDSIKPVPGMDQALRNIMQVLQADPLQYRNFSWRWYSVKSILKRNGYGVDQFYALGDFTDQAALQAVTPAPDSFILAQAFDLWGHLARTNLGSPDWYFDDGESYHIEDPDFGPAR